MNLDRALMKTFRPLRLAGVALVAVTIGFVTAPTALAQQSFKTAEAASDALVAAARAGDRKALVAILGPGASNVISSGDKVQDENTRQIFVSTYDAKHNVAVEGDKKATLVIGPDDWPFPIPMVQKDGQWQFDTAAGREEILYRRIGRNEMSAIQACLAYFDAQNDYADVTKNKDGMSIYAQKIVSSAGKKDGLYWPAAQGEQESPLGEAVAAASSQGYRVGGGREPFRGYYYKVLKRQGATAPGGALDYVVDGSMIGGFALVAWPAEYGNSGVMTFLVNNDGVVFQKDLGAATAKAAQRMTSFSPDHTWTKVVEEQK